MRLLADLLSNVLANLDSNADLASYALVCKEWLRPVRLLLYFLFYLTNSARFERFMRSLEQFTHLQSFVRSADIDCAQVAARRWYPRVDPTLMERMFTLAPGISSLNLFHLPKIGSARVQALRTLTQLTQLTTFELTIGQRVGQPQQSVDWSALVAILSGWKCLSRLRLERIWFDSHDPLSSTGLSRLTSLELMSAGLTDDELDWLVHSSSKMLTTLAYIESDSGSKLTEVGLVAIVERLATLEHLRLEASALSPVRLHELLPKLEHLASLHVSVTAVGKTGLGGASDSLEHLLLEASKKAGCVLGSGRPRPRIDQSRPRAPQDLSTRPST